MSKRVEDIDVRNRTYYFFNDISNIKNLIQIKDWEAETAFPLVYFAL